MDVRGVVRDATNGSLLPGADVSLSVGQEELAEITSNDNGEFTFSRTDSYIGKVLTCQVEKEKYQTKKETHKIEQDEVRLEIKLLRKEVPPPPPPPPKEIEVRFGIKDEKGNPLEGVNITLEVEVEQVGTGLSDKTGLFETTLRPDLEGKNLNYKAELADYESVKGEVQLKKQTSCQITMKKPSIIPKPPSKKFTWRPTVFGAIGGALAGFLWLLFEMLRIPGAFLWFLCPISGAVFGASLGIGLRGKRKILRMTIAGLVGFCVAVPPFFLMPRLLPIYFAIVGLSFGIGIKQKGMILWLTIAGLIGGFYGPWKPPVPPPLVLAFLGLCFGIVFGLSGKEQKQ